MLRNRGLADVEQPGSSCDAACMGDCSERHQLSEIHNRRLSG